MFFYYNDHYLPELLYAYASLHPINPPLGQGKNGGGEVNKLFIVSPGDNTIPGDGQITTFSFPAPPDNFFLEAKN